MNIFLHRLLETRLAAAIWWCSGYIALHLHLACDYGGCLVMQTVDSHHINVGVLVYLECVSTGHTMVLK